MIRYTKKYVPSLFDERSVIDGSFSWNIKSAIRFIRFIINFTQEDKNGRKEHFDIGEVVTSIGEDGKMHILLGQNKIITLAVLFLNILNHKPSITIQGLINGMLFKTIVNQDRTLRKIFVFDFANKELDTEVTNLLNDNTVFSDRFKILYDTISTKWTDSMNEDELNDFFRKFYFLTDFKELCWNTTDDCVDISPIIDFRN